MRVLLSECRLYVANRWINRIPFHALRQAFYRSCLHFKLGEAVSILMGTTFDAAGNFEMGARSVINQNCRLDTRGLIRMGHDVSISAEVIILTADHDMAAPDFAGRIRPVEIGNHVFIGTRALILPGVKLGDGSAVAAGAVVHRDVAAGAVVAGVPARVIGQRPEHLSYQYPYQRWFH